MGFRGGSAVKNPPANTEDTGLIPGPRRRPGGGTGHPLQYSCLRHPMDRGAWWATVHGVPEELEATWWLNNHIRFCKKHFLIFMFLETRPAVTWISCLCIMHKHHITVVSVGLLLGKRGFSASLPTLSFWEMEWMTAFSHYYLPPGEAVFFPERQFAFREYKRNLDTLISNRAPQSMTFHLMNITRL